MNTQTPVVDAVSNEIKGVAKEVAQNVGSTVQRTFETVKKHIGDNAKVYAFLAGGPVGLLVAHVVIESDKKQARHDETNAKETSAAA